MFNPVRSRRFAPDFRGGYFKIFLGGVFEIFRKILGGVLGIPPLAIPGLGTSLPHLAMPPQCNIQLLKKIRINLP